MKKYVIVVHIFLSVTLLYGQNSTSFFFNEFGLSANYSTVKDENTENRAGFGFGMYRTSGKTENRKARLVFGIEFNQTSQFKKKMYNNHFTYSTNVTYNFSYWSVPVLVRLSFGETNTFFIEPGAFLEFYVTGKMKGTKHSYSITNSTTTVADFNESADLSGINYGPSLGIGMRTLIGKHYLITKIDYKLGLNEVWDYYDQIMNRYLRLVLAYRI